MTAAAETRVAVSGSRTPRIYHPLGREAIYAYVEGKGNTWIRQTRCGLWLDATMTLADATEAGLRPCRHCASNEEEEG